MSLDAVTIIMAGASLVSLGVLVACVKRARVAGDLDTSTTLVVAMGVLATLPVAVVAVSGGLARRPDAVGELVAFFPGWYSTADSLAKAMLVLLATALFLGRLQSGRVVVHAAGLTALVLWTVAQLVSLQHGGGAPTYSSDVLFICLAAATVLPRGRGACLGAGIVGLVLAIASGIFAIFRHNVAFIVPCQGACSGLGFTGVLPNENLLGITLAAAIPFAYLGFRGRARVWLVVYLAGMAAASGSRTAIGASIIALVALFVVRPSVDADLSGLGRKATAWFVLAGAVAASIFFVRHHWDPSELTGRPQLWSVASDYIDRSPWFGYGPTRWASLYGSSEIPQATQRSTHNLWLDVLFIAGVVGAVLFVGILVMMLASAGRARTGVVVTLATIFTIGTTEGVWAITTFDFLSFSFIALMLIGPGRLPETVASVEAAKALSQRRAPSRELSYPRVS